MKLVPKALTAFLLVFLGQSNAMADTFGRLCPQHSNKTTNFRYAPAKMLPGYLQIKGVHKKPIECIRLVNEDDWLDAYWARYPEREKRFDKYQELNRWVPSLHKYDCGNTGWYTGVIRYSADPNDPPFLSFFDKNSAKQRAVVIKSQDRNVCTTVKDQGEDWLLGVRVNEYWLEFPEAGNKRGKILFSDFGYLAQPKPEIAF